jgi:putative ABC transport system substrate-binding protein
MPARGTDGYATRRDNIQGSVPSLAHPRRDAAGVGVLVIEHDGKRQKLLIELIPGARRTAARVDRSTTVPKKLRALADAEHARDVELVIDTVAIPEAIAPAIDAAKASDVAPLGVLASPLLFSNRPGIFERSAEFDLPAVYEWQEMPHEGGLVGYGPSIVQLYHQQMAPVLGQMLRGNQPADPPVLQPTKFALVISLKKTVKAVGLTVPPFLPG